MLWYFLSIHEYGYFSVFLIQPSLRDIQLLFGHYIRRGISYSKGSALLCSGCLLEPELNDTIRCTGIQSDGIYIAWVV